MCCINPGLVIGPPVELPLVALALSATIRPIWEIFSGSVTAVLPGFDTHGFVDVRDLASIHIWCMEHRGQGSDRRIRASAGSENPQGVIDTLRQAYPERRDVIPWKEVGEGHQPDIVLIKEKAFVNGVQASQAFGLKYTTYKQSILDTAKVLERYLLED